MPNKPWHDIADCHQSSCWIRDSKTTHASTLATCTWKPMVPSSSPAASSLQRWCSVQSCLFIQCWPCIFLEQCWGNLWNVSVAFAATSYQQRINWFKYRRKVMLFRWQYSEFSSTVLSGVSCTLYRVFTCAILPQKYQDNIEQDFFLDIVVWSLLDKVFTCTMLSQEY